jgi:hypothetical protein
MYLLMPIAWQHHSAIWDPITPHLEAQGLGINDKASQNAQQRGWHMLSVPTVYMVSSRGTAMHCCPGFRSQGVGVGAQSIPPNGRLRLV